MVDYQPQECGGMYDACITTEIIPGIPATIRACGIGLSDHCLGNTCVCKGTLCNGPHLTTMITKSAITSNGIIYSNSRSLVFFSFIFAITDFLRKMM